MEENTPTHLLSSLGVLAQFSIAKKFSKKEVQKEIKKIKKVFKETDKDKIQKLLVDALIEKTKTVESLYPPGLILPPTNSKQKQLDKFYMELTNISKTLSDKFEEKKLTAHQICFIINAIIHIFNITEEDFVEFYREFQKYKDGEFE
jgi:hypothetical protein